MVNNRDCKDIEFPVCKKDFSKIVYLARLIIMFA